MSSTIITIGRQYGSGGHKIGEFLANRLGLPYYDDELMVIEAKVDSLLAEEDGIDAGTVVDGSSADADNGIGTASIDPLYHREEDPISFELYESVIRKLAGKGDAIMIGRCADEILRSEGCKVLSVFIAAPIQQRIARTVRCEGVPADEVAASIDRKDSERKAFYEQHTGKPWGVAGSYDLYYDTSKLDIGSIIVDIIRHYKALKDQ